MGTVLTILLAGAVLGYALYLLVRMLKHPEGSCNCGCGGCPSAGNCHCGKQHRQAARMPAWKRRE